MTGMKDKLIIFGNGPAADVAFSTFDHDSAFDLKAFTVDRAYLSSKRHLGYPLVPFESVETSYPPDQYKLLIAIGFAKTNTIRANKYLEAIGKGYTLLTVISKKATTYPGLSIGKNCIVGANVVIHPGAKIGNNVVIRDNTFIGHDVIIEDHCFVGAGSVVAGRAHIREYAILGINSNVRESVDIGRYCIIGAGVTMLKNSHEKEVYMAPSPIKYPFPSDTLENY